MRVNRRQLIVIAAAVCAGCDRSEEQLHTDAAASKPTPATAQAADLIDAGPVANFPPNTASEKFRDQGFFVIHRDKQVFALSAICTHKGCKVRLAADQSYSCKCHGSTFDRNGEVTKGPATRKLPQLPVRTSQDGHLIVNTAKGK